MVTSTTDEVPRSAWVLGWACLAGQLTTLAEQGVSVTGSTLVSVPVGALVVAWVSYGVLRARLVRVWFAAILLFLIALFSVVGLVTDPSLFALIDAVTGVVAFAALLTYTRSGTFAGLREVPLRTAPSFGGLVAIAVAVGALGGLAAASPTDQQQSGVHVRIRL